MGTAADVVGRINQAAASSAGTPIALTADECRLVHDYIVRLVGIQRKAESYVYADNQRQTAVADLAHALGKVPHEDTLAATHEERYHQGDGK